MCGGFTCSKNALIALNIVYVVSSISFLFHCHLVTFVYNYYSLRLRYNNTIS